MTSSKKLTCIIQIMNFRVLSTKFRSPQQSTLVFTINVISRCKERTSDARNKIHIVSFSCSNYNNSSLREERCLIQKGHMHMYLQRATKETLSHIMILRRNIIIVDILEPSGEKRSPKRYHTCFMPIFSASVVRCPGPSTCQAMSPGPQLLE